MTDCSISEERPAPGILENDTLYKPFTSIVILAYNNLEYTKRCIQSIRKYTKSEKYEIIVVDNNSTDGTIEWLKKQLDIKLISNKENLGFPKGCNQGIEAALGDFILLLNNDTVVTKDWLSNLTVCLNSSPEIGAVGPVTNYCANYQQIPVTYKNLSGMQKFAANYNQSDSSKWEYVLKLVGYCMLFKRKVFDEIGVLDERFSPGNFEDDDISIRIIEAGFHLVLCRDTFIHHYGSISFRQTPESYMPFMEANRLKFIEKWGFNPWYSLMKRTEIAHLIDKNSDDKIKVLEVGCACGATLLYIKNCYKNAEIYGIEPDTAAAEVAATFAHVEASSCEDENIHFADHFFDYIIFADVLEHLRDPWSVLKRYQKYIRKGGYVLASIPNVMHYSVITELLGGRWLYRDSGILDKTHLRFFTPTEIHIMFADAGYKNIVLNGTKLADSPEATEHIDKLGSFAGENLKPLFAIYQVLVTAQNPN